MQNNQLVRWNYID